MSKYDMKKIMDNLKPIKDLAEGKLENNNPIGISALVDLIDAHLGGLEETLDEKLDDLIEKGIIQEKDLDEFNGIYTDLGYTHGYLYEIRELL